MPQLEVCNEMAAKAAQQSVSERGGAAGRGGWILQPPALTQRQATRPEMRVQWAWKKRYEGMKVPVPRHATTTTHTQPRRGAPVSRSCTMPSTSPSVPSPKSCFVLIETNSPSSEHNQQQQGAIGVSCRLADHAPHAAAPTQASESAACTASIPPHPAPPRPTPPAQ